MSTPTPEHERRLSLALRGCDHDSSPIRVLPEDVHDVAADLERTGVYRLHGMLAEALAVAAAAHSLEMAL